MKTLLMGLLLLASVAVAGEADNSWLNGIWKNQDGSATYTLKVTGDKVEGKTLVPPIRGTRLVSGAIQNGKVEGDKVTFEVSYSVGQSGNPYRCELKHEGEHSLKGLLSRPDGTKLDIFISKQ